MGTLDLTGKAAVITGASKGIGYAIAEAIAGVGANVLICARDEAEVREAAEKLDRDSAGRVMGVVCDVREHEEVRQLIGTSIEHFDRVDVLVNNAGVGEYAAIDELSPETWRRIIETNLNGAYYACHEAVPYLRRAGGGWIINIGSLAGKHAFAGGTAYNASKFGLVGFTEALMMDVRDDGIRVSCVMPGSVDSNFSGPGPHGSAPAGSSDWKLQPADVAEMVMDLLAFDSRALPSRVEMRPTRPKR